jgi:hypothetical protein
MGYEEYALYFWGTVFLIVCTLGAVVGHLVFSKRRQREPLVLLNIITAAGLCPLLAGLVVGLTMDLFSRGIMELDDSDFTVSVVVLGLLGIWSLLLSRGRRFPSCSAASVHPDQTSCGQVSRSESLSS